MISYQCHNCGSIHEIESIRMNLLYGQSAIGTLPAFQPDGTLWPGRYLLRRRVILTLSRGLQGRPVPARPGTG